MATCLLPCMSNPMSCMSNPMSSATQSYSRRPMPAVQATSLRLGHGPGMAPAQPLVLQGRAQAARAAGTWCCRAAGPAVGVPVCQGCQGAVRRQSGALQGCRACCWCVCKQAVWSSTGGAGQCAAALRHCRGVVVRRVHEALQPPPLALSAAGPSQTGQQGATVSMALAHSASNNAHWAAGQAHTGLAADAGYHSKTRKPSPAESAAPCWWSTTS
ncbi:hypothetical protein V8C86DRAFT_2887717 [Haematococcus lacustris]